VHLGPFHPLFCGLQLEDQLYSLVIESLVELMHCAGQVLHHLHKFGVDWDEHVKHSKSSHLGQHSRIIKSFQHLFDCKVEWYIFSKDVKVIVADSQGFNRGLWACIYLFGELLLPTSLHPHFVWDSMHHPIVDVGALNDFALMNDLISQVPSPLLLPESGGSQMAADNVLSRLIVSRVPGLHIVPFVKDDRGGMRHGPPIRYESSCPSKWDMDAGFSPSSGMSPS
jgi:hypothetical protein